MSELTGQANDQAHGAQPQQAPEPPDLSAGAEMAGDDAVVRRTKDGWRVGDADMPDLTSAMVLADLISAELAAPDGPALATAAGQDAAAQGTVGETAAEPASVGTGRSGKTKAKGKAKDPAPSETSKLRATIGQLEQALTARIRVEQAIGVLAERHRIQPRQAFEQLRTAARNRGRRVIDIASDVVASATNPLLQLPDELSRPRATARQVRRGRQTPSVLGSE